MVASTITWGLRYDVVGSDPPNGAASSQRLAEDTDATFTIVNNALDARLDVLEAKSLKLIGRARRTTPSDASTGLNVGVLRLNVPITIGRGYVLKTASHPTSSVTTDNIETGLKFDLASNADASDPILPGARFFGLWGQIRVTETYWVATATGTLSVALYVRRELGTGNCTCYADTTERFTEIFAYEVSTDPGNTGVNLP